MKSGCEFWLFLFHKKFHKFHKISCFCKVYIVHLYLNLQNITNMETKELGCVYFFRHVGLTPVKIGYTSNKSPIKRFEQFKTYAPFGAEILGFIQTNEAKKYETDLHLKYSAKRLDGEWFEISEEDINYEVNRLMSKEQIKEKNEFHINWATYIEQKNNYKNFVKEKLKNNSKYSDFAIIYKADRNISKSRLSEMLNVSRRTIYNWIEQFEKTNNIK